MKYFMVILMVVLVSGCDIQNKAAEPMKPHSRYIKTICLRGVEYYSDIVINTLVLAPALRDDGKPYSCIQGE